MSANEMDRFYDLMQAQGKEITEQGKLLAALEQGQKDMNYRLFGNGQPGTIQYLAGADEKLRVDHNALAKTVSDMDAQRTGDRRWLKGVLWVVGGEIAAVGFYFKYLHDAFAPIIAALAKK